MASLLMAGRASLRQLPLARLAQTSAEPQRKCSNQSESDGLVITTDLTLWGAPPEPKVPVRRGTVGRVCSVMSLQGPSAGCLSMAPGEAALPRYSLA